MGRLDILDKWRHEDAEAEQRQRRRRPWFMGGRRSNDNPIRRERRGGPRAINSWTCHVCGESRPDDMIDVHSRIRIVNGIEIQENVRYCKDSTDCARGAATKTWLTNATDRPPDVAV